MLGAGAAMDSAVAMVRLLQWPGYYSRRQNAATARWNRERSIWL